MVSRFISKPFHDCVFVHGRCFLHHIWGLFFCLLVLSSCSFQSPKTGPKAHKGVLDLTSWNFDRDGVIKLDGQWEFYWQTLLSPEDFANKNTLPNPDWITVPGTWKSQLAHGQPLPGHGYATYRLHIKLGRGRLVYGVKIKGIGTAYKLWANGELLAMNGIVGETEDKMQAQTLPRVCYNKTEAGTLDLILQVSNFMDRFGGPWDNLQFGEAKKIAERWDRDVSLDLLPLGILLVMCFYHFLLFVLRPKELSTLIFSLFCAVAALLIALQGERLLVYLFPNMELADKYENSLSLYHIRRIANGDVY